MPEIKNATGILSQIARPVDNIGLSFLKRTKKRQVIKGVIFGIRILNTDIITPGREKACAKGSPFPFIFFMPHDSHFLMFRGKFLCNLIAAIGGTVVNDDKL